jgi:hypothetical protein
VTPFKTAHDFCGGMQKEWLFPAGAVSSHFEDFHRKLPKNYFHGLSDMLGWDPLNEAMENWKGERWPILWVEDDPSMVSQFVSTGFNDKSSRGVWVPGLLNSLRHKITDGTGYQSEASWDDHFHHTL